jgi:hypothetical protein
MKMKTEVLEGIINCISLNILVVNGMPPAVEDAAGRLKKEGYHLARESEGPPGTGAYPFAREVLDRVGKEGLRLIFFNYKDKDEEEMMWGAAVDTQATHYSDLSYVRFSIARDYEGMKADIGRRHGEILLSIGQAARESKIDPLGWIKAAYSVMYREESKGE